MKKYRRVLLAIFVLISIALTQSPSSAQIVFETDKDLIIDEEYAFVDETEAGLNGKHGDETRRCMSFVQNSYQSGQLLTAEEKEAELAAITDPSTVEVIEFIHDGILNMEEEIFLEQFEIDRDTLHVCFQALLNNYPDMFFIGMNYSYTVFTDGVIEALAPVYTMSQDEIIEKQNIIDNEVSNILECIEPGMNRFDQVAAVNNYFASHYTYDYEHLNDDSYSQKYTMPTLFENKTAVCQGYSLAFMYIMNKLGIPCTTAQSPPMSHMWNLVQAKEGSDNWYNIDTTWDTIFYSEYGRSPYTFFLKSDNRFVNMHAQPGFTTGQDHYGYQPDNWANDEIYNDIAIANAGTEPFYSGGNWYFGKGKADFGNSVTIMRYNSDTNTSENVLSVNDEWAVAGGIYEGYCFNSVGTYDNKLYYNDSLNIYEYDPETGKSTVFLAKPNGVVEGQTPIFEVRVEGDNLIYVTAPDYPGNGVVVTEHSVKLGGGRIEYIGEIEILETGISISMEDVEDASNLVVSFFDADGRFIKSNTVKYTSAIKYEGEIPAGADSLSAFAVKIDENGCYMPLGKVKTQKINRK